MTQNKNHWYDGWLYDKIIAPNQNKLFGKIINLIDAQSNILDVGCGTGRLAFALVPKCKSVLGIDISVRNINRANLRLQKYPDNKISFQHSTVSELSRIGQTRYDYAVMTYVLHEVNEEERIPFLKEIAQVADKIIIGDYLVPKPKGFDGYLTEVIEFIAGAEHYRNYKSFMANGGSYHLADKAGLKIISETNNLPSTYHIVVMAK
jgi:SAM-dependent methyltransferase